MKKNVILYIILLFTASSIFFAVSEEINIDHLLFLRDEFKVESSYEIGYWIYADLKSGEYVHVDAPGEGVTCVDDVARAGLFYLYMFENTENEYYAGLAKECIEFVLAMRAEGGDYYNFIFEDGSINKAGLTSRPTANWWALRAMWLLAKTVDVFSDHQHDEFNQQYLENCLKEINKTAVLFEKNLDYNGLIKGYTDLTSLYVITLSIAGNNSSEFEKKWKKTLRKAADGLLYKIDGNGVFSGIIDEGKDNFNFHGWGSRQVQALSLAYEKTSEKKYLHAAEDMAMGLYPSMITYGPFYELRKDGMVPFPCIAYAAEAAVTSLYELYRVSGKEEYAYLMSLCTSFFYGNNHLDRDMIGQNGEGYDGMENIFINRNSGAESTISYLLSLSLVQRMENKFRNFINSRRIYSCGPEFIDAQNLDTGLSSYSSHIINGFNVLKSESLKLKGILDMKVFGYDAFLLGEFNSGTVLKAYINSEKAETNVDKKINVVNIGQIKGEPLNEAKLTVIMKGETDGYLNQIALIPNVIFQIVNNDAGVFLWSYNRANEDAFVKLPDGSEHTINSGTLEIKRIDDFSVQFSSENDNLNYIPVLHDKDGYSIIILDDLFNNNGIGFERKPGNLDNFGAVSGAYFSGEEIFRNLSDGILSFEGISYLITDENQNDNFTLKGQTINIAGEYKTVNILGCSDHGDFSGDIEIEYEDSSKTYLTLGLSDWCGLPTLGEKIALETPFRYNAASQKEWLSPKFYSQTFKIEGKKIKRITFPEIPTMHIFAISLEK